LIKRTGQPVYTWHVDVRDDDVNGCLNEDVERAASIGGYMDRLRVESLQNRGDHLALKIVVFDDHDAQLT
jgi:hypothetical protein